ncbi:MAG TPA: transglutaminase-like domain-containing protein, partial [Kofleriaceae bacterium]|nr:transglutaminase-like domain-containing protein [Kofleriaceae bacterium]
AGVDRLPVARIAALSLVDRWLKNAAPDLRAARVADALARCRELVVGGRADEIGDAPLARLAGADCASLDQLARSIGAGDAWLARLDRFAAAVLEALEAQPRSLSQASAEELLARQVYTDPGHFLVELLQNADDAGARCFAVAVDDDRVTVEHDGAPFDARDVVGVLSIGQTTKSAEQIGFFGVGFKSVYEICERPQVYSGPFAFEIADVSIPRPLAPHPAARAGRTVLVLPLRDPADPDRHPDRLFERAQSLPGEVLLALNRVQRIEARRGPRRRSLALVADEPGRVQVVEDGRGRAYAVARGAARYPGAREAHRAEATPILVAIALDDSGAARPASGPTIYSHLPTGERSGLRFLVHARFDVPLDRERLDLSSRWNRWALVEAAPLFARALADLAGRGGAALDVVPLPEELAADAYRDLARAAAARLADAPLLPGAAGELVAASAALSVDDARLARALAGIEVVPGRRPLRPLARRDAEVATMLGARPLTGGDVVAAIARDAAGSGERFAAPWGARGLADLAAALGEGDAADLAPLTEARFLPDHEGCARAPGELVAATGELRELLAAVRPVVAEELAGPGPARFLERVGVRTAHTRDLVAELAAWPAARAIAAAAGAERIIAHLAAAPPGELTGVHAARVVPTAGGDLAAIGQVWLTGDGPLAEMVRELERAPPLCAREIERACGASLRRLGARCLDLPALVDLVAGGAIAPSLAEAGRFHLALDGAADELGPSLSARLARAPIFPDRDGVLRPLRSDHRASGGGRGGRGGGGGGGRGDDGDGDRDRGGDGGDGGHLADGGVALLADDEEVQSLWPGRWLRRDVAALAYVRRLGVEPIGPDAVARALVRGEIGGERRRAAFAYLTARGTRLATERAEELAAAPLWPDGGGRLRRLADLRRDSPLPSVAALYRLWPRAAAIEPGDEPGSALGLARALGLDHIVVEPGLDTAIDDLVAGSAPALSSGAGADLLDLEARRDIEEAVVALLRDAAGQLPRARLERALDAPIYRARGGLRLPLGRWSAASPERCHRGADGLDAALAGGRFPVLESAAEAALTPLLDACGVRPATILDLVLAVASAGALEPDAAGAVRDAMVAAAAELAAADPASRARAAELAIWPATDGRLLPAAGVVRGAELDLLLPTSAAEWRAAAPWPAILADTVEPAAARVAGAIAFAEPVAAVARVVVALARPGAPLAEQAPLLSTPARVAEVAALLHAARRPDLAPESLPVGVDAEGRLVARRLLAASDAEAELMRGLPLRESLAHPEWARSIDVAAPGALERVSLRQLVAALLAASPAPVRPAEHPSLATPEARRRLHDWLAARGADIAGDEQARGALGRAAVILSAGLWLRAPRDLLFDADLPDLGIDWNAAEEVPAGLVDWLRATFRPGSKQIAPLVDHLLAAADRAIAAADGARLTEVLHQLARALGAERPEGLEEQARRFKLRRRLRVETDRGQFARPRSLLALDPVAWDLIARFAGPPPPRVASRYRDRDLVLRLCRAAGAEAELDQAALERALAGEGVRPGPDAPLALACYAALVATRRPELRRRLRESERAWVPDRAGQLRRPGALYREDAEVEEIVGPDDRLFPHPELAHRVPEASAWIGFRGAEQAALGDVAAHVIALRAGGRPVPDAVLRWLDDGIAAGRLAGPAVQGALGDCDFLRDDSGRYRRAEHLVLEGTRPLFGERRGDFAGAGLARLVAALRIARRPGKREVVGFLTEIADETAGGADLLADDPGLAERLPRCIDVLVAAGGRGPARLPIACEGAAGYVIALLPDAAGSIGFDGDLPLSPALADDSDAEAWRAYLRGYGVGPASEPAADAASRGAPASPSSLPRSPPPPGAPAAPARRGLLDRIADLFRPAPVAAAPDEAEPDEDAADAAAASAAADDDEARDAADEEPPRGREPARRPPPARRDRDRERGRGGDRDRHRDRDGGRDRERDRDQDRGNAPGSSAPARDGGAVDQRRWFRPERRLGPQLRAGRAWLDDRRHAAEFGLAHSPRALPAPYLYAPVALFAAFRGRQQTWDPCPAPPEWRRGGRTAGRVSMRGRLPGGAAVLPLPLYGRVASIDTDGARVVEGEGGAAVLIADAGADADRGALITVDIDLGEAPDFTRAEPARGEPELLRPTTADGELPDEALALLDRLEQDRAPALDRALDIREFVRTRYAYDPTYLEDPAIATWLRQRARGRSNEHIAALHAGGDAEHLGRGVCYELNLLACELLRRAGIPAAIATGWTLDRGFVDEPDHLFAMALLETGAGPRWLPVDASTTRAGRPLHAGHRPPGPWRATRPGAAPPRSPALDDAGRRASTRGRDEPARAPVGELLRVARHVEDVTGRRLGSREEILRACRALLSDPARAAELAALLGGPPDDD